MELLKKTLPSVLASIEPKHKEQQQTLFSKNLGFYEEQFSDADNELSKEECILDNNDLDNIDLESDQIDPIKSSPVPNTPQPSCSTSTRNMVIACSSRQNQNINPLMLAQLKEVPVFQHLFEKLVPIVGKSQIAATIPEFSQGLLKAYFTDLDNLLHRPLKVETPVVPWSDDDILKVWFDHINNNYMINDVPGKLFVTNKVKNIEEISKLILLRQAIRLLLLLTPVIELYINEQEDEQVLKFCYDHFFLPIVSLFQAYARCVYTLRKVAIPIHLKRNSILLAPISKGSLWTFTDDDKKFCVNKSRASFYRNNSRGLKRRRNFFRSQRINISKRGRFFRNYQQNSNANIKEHKSGQGKN